MPDPFRRRLGYDASYACAECGNAFPAEASGSAEECPECGFRSFFSGRRERETEVRPGEVSPRLHEEIYEGLPAAKAVASNVVRYVPPAPSDHSEVYFIGGVGTDDPVKIGFTTRGVRSRLGSLRTGSAVPLVILAQMDGGAEMERRLHRQFAEFRLSGEWFRRSPELLAFIASISKPKELDAPSAKVVE